MRRYRWETTHFGMIATRNWMHSVARFVAHYCCFVTRTVSYWSYYYC